MEKEITPQEDLKEMKGIRELFNITNPSEIQYTNYEYKFRDWCLKNGRYWTINAFRDFLKQKINEIAERNEFNGGCGKDIPTGLPWSPWSCTRPCGSDTNQLCPDCQAKKEIQEVWENLK